MKTTLFLNIATRIIVLFVVAMFGTYIPDYLRDFFGDHFEKGGRYGDEQVLVWGIRHWMYVIMMTLLFLLSLASLMVSILDMIKKEYKVDLASKPEFYSLTFYILLGVVFVIGILLHS